jgi:hypothetical protein
MGKRIDIKPLPSLARLQKLLVYDKASGVLTWKVLPTTSRSNICHNNKCGGKVAGTIGLSGYLVVGISKKYYLAHRIIWKMMTGSDPVDQVDHTDANRLNNHWSNLREATNGLNIQNSKIRNDNTSGIKGVHWDMQHKKWRAVINANGKSKRLGRYSSLNEAARVISKARLEMHGSFARIH